MGLELNSVRGKKIMVVCDPDQSLYAAEQIAVLESFGATVVRSHYGAIYEPNAGSILHDIEEQDPAVDALLIFKPNIGMEESKATINNILEESHLPAVICDKSTEQKTFSRELTYRGAKYLELTDREDMENRVMFALGDVIANKEKSGVALNK